MNRDVESLIRDNVAEVRSRIDAAAQRSGRTAEDVRLVAVTKYVDADVIRAVVAAGCHDLGESRPQALWTKAGALSDDSRIRWHMIGHMQRNKLRRTLPLLAMLHSADSLRLIEEIDRQAADLGRSIDVLIEVNVSGDQAKHGFDPDDMARAIRSVSQYANVNVRGLMCMGALEGGVQRARRDFAALRELRGRHQAECPEGVSLEELSMGMSGDFEAAIEEGATMVRVGSVLYRGVIEEHDG